MEPNLSPLALGIFLAVRALSGIAINTAFGRWLDLLPSPARAASNKSQFRPS
jgi:hypothetical protein